MEYWFCNKKVLNKLSLKTCCVTMPFEVHNYFATLFMLFRKLALQSVAKECLDLLGLLLVLCNIVSSDLIITNALCYYITSRLNALLSN